jgi:Bifunctional DNA primase/polymerase, N-terminal
MTSRLPFALDAASHGWPVFPLRPGTKRPQAGFTSWESRATVDPERITGWWSRHPHDNVAIATGPAGLVVVDLDVAGAGERAPADWPSARGGLDVYRALATEHEHVPTWTVGTGSGGWHLYYRAPARGGPWRNTAGRIG